MLCDNDVGLWINAIGETSSASLGDRRRARDGSIGTLALRGSSWRYVANAKFDNAINPDNAINDIATSVYL